MPLIAISWAAVFRPFTFGLFVPTRSGSLLCSGENARRGRATSSVGLSPPSL
jgi:hypothetical protein